MLLVAMITVVAVAAEVTAAAPDHLAPEAASVLRIDGPDVYVDLGRAAGARVGDRVRVSRAVRVLRPGAREALVDRFTLGELQLLEVGDVLARARPDPELARQLRLGDVVEPPPRFAESAARPAVGPGPGPSCSGAPDLDALAFREAWLKAQPLAAERRAEHWEAYLTSHHDGALDEPLRREIALLRAARGSAEASSRAPVILKPAVSAPDRAFEGDPLEVVLTFPDPSPAPSPRAAVLNWRPQSEALYRTVAFSAEGPTWRVRLPAEAARAPGLEYWVGAVDEKGAERGIAGTGPEPRQIGVRALPGKPPEPRTDRSEMETRTDFADWNHLKGNDYQYAVESDYLYRVQGFVQSVKLGLGVYQGVGQPLRQAIADEQAARGGEVHYHTRAVGYDYVFTELDLRGSDTLGFVARGLAGVNRDGFGSGIEGKVRIGRDPGTHLVASAGFTNGIGNRNELKLAWDQVRGWPMSASVIVTNEPVREDYGVRFVYQVGRAFARWADISLRVGYELRDIKHSGFGLGLATNFHW